MMIKAIFWDSDNTLVDTGELHWRKHYHVLRDHAIHLDESDRIRIYTNNGQQNWQWLVNERGLQMAQSDYLALIDDWYKRNIGQVRMRSGVKDIMAWAKAHDIPQAVVSNGRRDSVMMALEVHAIPDVMSFILCKEDYQGRKPGPEPYFAALARLNDMSSVTYKPEECLVIEDDPKGVQSAATAGMKVIHRKLSADQESAPEADICVYNPEDFVAAVKGYFS